MLSDCTRHDFTAIFRTLIFFIFGFSGGGLGISLPYILLFVFSLQVLASRTKIYIILEFITGGELFDKIVRPRAPPCELFVAERM